MNRLACLALAFGTLGCLFLISPVYAIAQDLSEAQRRERCENNRKYLADYDRQLEAVEAKLKWTMSDEEFARARVHEKFLFNLLDLNVPAAVAAPPGKWKKSKWPSSRNSAACMNSTSRSIVREDSRLTTPNGELATPNACGNWLMPLAAAFLPPNGPITKEMNSTSKELRCKGSVPFIRAGSTNSVAARELSQKKAVARALRAPGTPRMAR